MTDDAEPHRSVTLGEKVARLVDAARSRAGGWRPDPGQGDGAKSDSPPAIAPQAGPRVPLGAPSGAQVFENYMRAAPSAQATVDIFRGEWASRLPAPYEDVTAGPLSLFADDRLLWMFERLGTAQGKEVLELGPLDGGHSYMLEKSGASSVKAIEGNIRAYLRCLVIKELLSLKRVNFLCGDFVEWLRTNDDHFGLCVASGVLYHMRNPVELVELISKSCDSLFLWTHYYDENVIEGSRHSGNFVESLVSEQGGFTHTLHRHLYGPDLDAGFCGGNAHYSMWMERADILRAVEHFGYKEVEVGFDEPDHQNGPCLALVARRG